MVTNSGLGLLRSFAVVTVYFLSNRFFSIFFFCFVSLVQFLSIVLVIFPKLSHSVNFVYQPMATSHTSLRIQNHSQLVLFTNFVIEKCRLNSGPFSYIDAFNTLITSMIMHDCPRVNVELYETSVRLHHFHRWPVTKSVPVAILRSH